MNHDNSTWFDANDTTKIYLGNGQYRDLIADDFLGSDNESESEVISHVIMDNILPPEDAEVLET